MVSPNPTIRFIGEGFVWTEGPLYVPDSNFLIFSDIPQNKIFRWRPNMGIDVYLEPAGYTGKLMSEGWEKGSNGLLLTPNKHLLLCQHGDRRIAISANPISDIKPRYITLVDRFQGKRLNSPNDAVIRSNGDVYFTDPPYGLPGRMNDDAKELDFQGIYRVRTSGNLDLISKELNYPNGIALSPDETKLYVANSDRERPLWMVYELNSEGLAKKASIFYNCKSEASKDKGLPDGMAVAKNGWIFATGPGGVWIFNPNGQILGKFLTGELTSNCTLTPDERTLFATADNYLLKIDLK